VLLDGDRVIGTALDRRVVGDDDALDAFDATDTCDDPGRVEIAGVHFPRRELADLEERRAFVEQTVHALTGQQLAARLVTFGVAGAAVLPDGSDARVEFFDERLHRLAIRGETRRCRIDGRGVSGRALLRHRETWLWQLTHPTESTGHGYIP